MKLTTNFENFIKLMQGTCQWGCLYSKISKNLVLRAHASTFAPMGVKFSVEESMFVQLLHIKFHPTCAMC